MTRRKFLCLGAAGAVAASGSLLVGCAPMPTFSEYAWDKATLDVPADLLYAPHKNGNLYFNPWLEREKTFSVFSSIKYGLFAEEFSPVFPEERYRNVENDYGYLKKPGDTSISFVGHATFIINLDGDTVVTDPFLSSRALVAKKAVIIDFNFDALPDKPVVLITHNHYDHLDKYSVQELVKKDAVFITGLGVGEALEDYGAKEVYELDWWQSITIKNLKYTFLPAQHWSRRIGQSENETLWGGFMISGTKTIYFAGDSGYFMGFREFGKLYDIDYAIVGAGAYIPRWFMHYSHANVQEFFNAAFDLQAKVTIPMHFGIIHLGREPILYPLHEINERLEREPELRGFITPLRVGEYIAG